MKKRSLDEINIDLDVTIDNKLDKDSNQSLANTTTLSVVNNVLYLERGNGTKDNVTLPSSSNNVDDITIHTDNNNIVLDNNSTTTHDVIFTATDKTLTLPDVNTIKLGGFKLKIINSGEVSFNIIDGIVDSERIYTLNPNVVVNCTLVNRDLESKWAFEALDVTIFGVQPTGIQLGEPLTSSLGVKANATDNGMASCRIGYFTNGNPKVLCCYNGGYQIIDINGNGTFNFTGVFEGIMSKAGRYSLVELTDTYSVAVFEHNSTNVGYCYLMNVNVLLTDTATKYNDINGYNLASNAHEIRQMVSHNDNIVTMISADVNGKNCKILEYTPGQSVISRSVHVSVDVFIGMYANNGKTTTNMHDSVSNSYNETFNHGITNRLITASGNKYTNNQLTYENDSATHSNLDSIVVSASNDGVYVYLFMLNSTEYSSETIIPSSTVVNDCTVNTLDDTNGIIVFTNDVGLQRAMYTYDGVSLIISDPIIISTDLHINISTMYYSITKQLVITSYNDTSNNYEANVMDVLI